jgi:hypothetical protein
MKIISILLLLASAFLSIKHGWDAFQPASVEQAKMMAILGVTKSTLPYFGIFSILIGVMLFFLSNVLNALTIVLIMAMSLRAGNFRIALMEIPFLALPLIMIWLKYPFRN